MVVYNSYSAWAGLTERCNDTVVARVYLDRELIKILRMDILREIRSAALPDDPHDDDDMLDRVNYVKDLSKSLNYLSEALHELDVTEGLENIPPEVDEV